ncbi:hypothetical protein B0H66DRAFT_609047 [Apodospora peruviana]|uniref:Uncharacterized protein n=1 Tax=Apodospora peruviana TaxID=516989 RepID=A0AAE0HS19_9PEZI|nr:hypothetical protein B0H66DRAFT_609047 [Apodospora peruviana]
MDLDSQLTTTVQGSGDGTQLGICFIYFIFGFACAIGHHAFYASLNGKPANDQFLMLRYGTVLAFASKAGLSVAVIVAFQQRVWTTVRRRVMSIAALDSLFAATEDLIALLNWELFRTRGSPSSSPSLIDQLFEIPASLWNTTKPEGADPPEGWFDYYTAPSPSFQRTATIGAFLEQAVMRKNAQVETCGSGWNCTFEINFTAPAYKCTELASGVGSKPVNLTQESGGSIAAPFDTDILLPKGKYSYYAFTSGGEYSTTQMKDVGIGGKPISDPPYPKNFGALRTEPVVWIGYSNIADPSKPVPQNPSDPGWDTAFIPSLFACENYESHYVVTFNYTDAMQSTKVTNLTFLRPVVNTTYLPHIDADDGTADNVTANPESNYIFPQDVARYRRTAAYHSLGFMLRYFLNGTIEMEDRSLVNPVANTNAIQTKLIDPKSNYFPRPGLAGLVQNFYEEIIMSMLGNPQFVAVVWAAKPDQQSGGGKTFLPFDEDEELETAHGDDGDADEDDGERFLYPCTKSRTANMYHYNVRDLWIVYTIAILMSLVGVVFGAMAISAEEGGKVRDTLFSSIVAATRGPALDKVRWEKHDGSFLVGDDGNDGGSVHVAEDVKKLRAGYGLLARGEGFGSSVIGLSASSASSLRQSIKRGGYYYGFGLEGDVQQIRVRRGSTVF